MSGCSKCWSKIRQSKLTAVVIVYATLMIDSMLLTSVVPILPKYFLEHHILGEGTNSSPFVAKVTATSSLGNPIFTTEKNSTQYLSGTALNNLTMSTSSYNKTVGSSTPTPGTALNNLTMSTSSYNETAGSSKPTPGTTLNNLTMSTSSYKTVGNSTPIPGTSLNNLTMSTSSQNKTVGSSTPIPGTALNNLTMSTSSYNKTVGSSTPTSGTTLNNLTMSTSSYKTSVGSSKPTPGTSLKNLTMSTSSYNKTVVSSTPTPGTALNNLTMSTSSYNKSAGSSTPTTGTAMATTMTNSNKSSSKIGSSKERSGNAGHPHSRIPSKECAGKHDAHSLAAKNIYLALLLSSKPFVQMITNIFVGPLCDRIGFNIPMLGGYTIMIASSLIFAFGTTYWILFFARALQGVGSACASTAGMALVASLYSDDDERGKKLGVALGGIAVGVLVGPIFGGFLYELSGGKELPFVILAFAAFVIALAQLMSRIVSAKKTSSSADEGSELVEPSSESSKPSSESAQPSSESSKPSSSLLTLLKDPYILVASISLMMGNMSIGVLETSLPTWLLTTDCATEWKLGLVMVPAAVCYAIVTAIFSRVGTSGYRWILVAAAFIATGAGNILLAFFNTFQQSLGPVGVIGVATGLADSSLFPILGHLADIRHSSDVYGTVYAIGDAAFCVAFIVGPLLAGTIVRAIGFQWVMIVVAAVNILFSPLAYFLKNPPARKEEEQPLLRAVDANPRYTEEDEDLLFQKRID